MNAYRCTAWLSVHALRCWQLATLGAVLGACNPSNPTASSSPGAGPAEHADDAFADDGHTDAGDERGASDLDRPVDELFGATCEHGKRAFECDECRYEVGVSRVPAALTEGGVVRIVRAERHRVETAIQLTGEVQFDERRIAHVSPQVEGMVRKVDVALGDRVEKGQSLLEIESVAVGEAQSSHREALGLLELARRNFERISELRAQGISSEREYLAARQELDAAQIRADAALGRLNRLGSGGAAGGRAVLRAPMAGSVLVMHAVSGEVVKSDESLLTVGDSATLWVWADLYERDLAALQRGQTERGLTASVSVRAYPGVEFPGVVDLVSPAMDETSRTVKVRIEVGNADGRLLAGMFASVRVFLPGEEDALAVPQDAVLEDEGRSFVFVHHRDEYYVRRPVVAGRSWPGWVEIREGLTDSQSVVTEGSFLLKSDVLRSKMGAGCAD